MDRFEKDDGEIQHGDHSLDDEDEVSDEEPNLPTEAKSPEEKSAEENSAEDESGPASALGDFGGAEEGDLCTTEEEEEDEGTCWPRKRERLVTLSNAPNMMAHAGQPLPEDSDEDSAAGSSGYEADSEGEGEGQRGVVERPISVHKTVLPPPRVNKKPKPYNPFDSESDRSEEEEEPRPQPRPRKKAYRLNFAPYIHRLNLSVRSLFLHFAMTVCIYKSIATK